jgi:YggT family protein
MLATQIFQFLISVIFGTLMGAALMRCYLNFFSVPMGNPLGQFLIALTDWIVRPLRRVFKPVNGLGRFDAASFIAAALLSLAQTALLFALLGLNVLALDALLWRAFIELLRIALQTLVVLLIIYAVMSWVNPNNPMYGMLDRMFTPLLTPIRRVLPLVGGVDLSPMALIVLLQIALMVVARLG